MILKASQRGGGRDLAAHLSRTDENEHVRLHELRGFTAQDLRGALREIEAISRGTKCRQYLFSLSLSPPEQEIVPVAIFERAIARIEERLGLSGQPRAILFHEKEGRRHAHCVWSRIDAATMTARPLPFFKNRLMEISRSLYLEHGWKLPQGLIRQGMRDPTNFTLAEWQQAKRQGADPRLARAALQECWSRADSRAAFERALEERAFFLARGDRRGFVVLDHLGTVHALPRMLDLKTKEVRARLGGGEDLRSVAETLSLIGRRMTPAIRRHVAESRERFVNRTMTLARYREEMTRLHRDARAQLDVHLEAEWQAETNARAARLPGGLLGLWHRLTGRYREVRARNEAEAVATQARQGQAREDLIAQQRAERRVLQEQVIELRHRQAEQLLTLRGEIGRYLAFTRGDGLAAERGRSASLGLSLSRDPR